MRREHGDGGTEASVAAAWWVAGEPFRQSPKYRGQMGHRGLVADEL